jgi:hypothetical protein
MNSTVLEVIRTACAEMSVQQPTSVAANPELIPQQLFALYNATGEMLVKRRYWRNLFGEATINCVDGQGAYPLPDDFARPLSQTEWDQTNRWPMIGPETPQQWQYLKSGILSTGPRERFRLVGNTIEVWPVPGANTGGGGLPLPLTLSYYYVSKGWVIDGDSITTTPQVLVRKNKATKDIDTCIFEDRLMVSGIKFRFYAAKGFDTTSFAAEWQSNLDDAIAQDQGAPVLSLARSPQFPLITVFNIPDGNWPAN